MSKNIKTDYKIKLKAVLEYRDGKKSLLDISKELSVSREQIRRWVYKYESLGEEGLKNKTTHKCYSREVKIKAIREYLSGEYSQIDICIKYEISSVSVLQRWIMLYNNHHNITKSYPDKGSTLIIKARKTTLDERIEIVGFCIANNFNYELTSDKYNVSYNQIYTWVKKYKQSGYEGLEDRPTVKPLFHSDRGFQYIHKAFKAKLDKQEAVQSMSRVARCIDNGHTVIWKVFGELSNQRCII